MRMRWLVWWSRINCWTAEAVHGSYILLWLRLFKSKRTAKGQRVITLLWFISCSSLHRTISPLRNKTKTKNQRHRMSVTERAMAVITDGDVSHGSGLRGECVLTYGPWVELCVQNLHRMHQVPLWAGRGLCWISWTPHFLFFFVLHLRIDVEAWDLPWGKIYSEAKDDKRMQRAHPSALNLNGSHCTNSYDNTIWGEHYWVVYTRGCTTWFFFWKPTEMWWKPPTADDVINSPEMRYV